MKESKYRTKLCDHIRKTPEKKTTHKKNNFNIFNAEGVQLTEIEAVSEMWRFWEDVYQKCDNKIKETWENYIRTRYSDTHENQMHTTTDQTVHIPNELREHMHAVDNIITEI